MTFDQVKEIINRIGAGELNIDQVKAEFARVLAAKESVIADLNTRTVAQLLALRWTYKRSDYKKGDYVKAIWHNLLSQFHFSDTIGYDPFKETHEQALIRTVNAGTQQQLDAYLEEKRKRKEEFEAAIKDPKTLDDFQTFLRYKGRDAMTPELQARYDALVADRQLSQQAREDERKRTIAQANVDEDLSLQIHEGVHTKHGHKIWTVTMSKRISAEQYRELNSKAKRLGGYYSSYTGGGAKAGFVFKSEDNAKAFTEVTSGSVTKADRSEEKAARVGDKLREMADRWETEGRNKLNQDRLTNTHRRASMAAHAEAEAEKKILNAQLMRRAADAIDAGTIKYLAKVTSWAQFDDLLALLRQGAYTRWNKENLRMDEKAFDPEQDVMYVEYPYPRIYVEQFNRIGNALDGKKGFKKILQGFVKRWPKGEEGKRFADFYVLWHEKDVEDMRKILNTDWAEKEFKYTFLPEQLKRFDRLQRMGVVSIQFLRAALRELAELKAGTSALSAEEKRALELKQAEREFIGMKEKGFFPTPPELAQEVAELAEIEPNMSVLEPSAGLGHLADAILEAEPDIDLDVVEWWDKMRTFLKKKGFNVVGDDIFQLKGKKYDRIVMNPPFEELADIDHVRYCFDNLLKAGGRLVAIMAANKEGQRQKVQDFRDFVDQYGYSKQNEAGAFKSAFRSTGVNTITVVLDKPASEEAPEPDFLGALSGTPEQTYKGYFENKDGTIGVREFASMDVLEMFREEQLQEGIHLVGIETLDKEGKRVGLQKIEKPSEDPERARELKLKLARAKAAAQAQRLRLLKYKKS